MDQFDVTEVLRQRGAERYALQQRYLNPQLPRMLHTIGFDKVYDARLRAPTSTTRTATTTSTCSPASG